MDLPVIKGQKLIADKRLLCKHGGLRIYCGDSRYFVVSCSRKLKAVSGQVEINTFKEIKKRRKKIRIKGKERK
jgi:hypothetical protein